MMNGMCKECGACEAVCPEGAVTLVENKYGFRSPVIEEGRCINCHLCDMVCSRTRNMFHAAEDQVCYAARAKNMVFSSSSRSGGGYRVLSDYMVSRYHAVVYGAALKGTQVRHERIVHRDDLIRLSGSKYVWSEHTGCLKEVEADLKAERWVVFSGLPCQVAALLGYLECKGIDTQKLLTCDLVCHGCPPAGLYQDYLRYQAKKHKTCIETIQFRDKEHFGWKAHIETLTTNKGRIYSDIWARIFYSHLGLKSSCFACDYKRTERAGDISLGDCWNTVGIKSGNNNRNNRECKVKSDAELFDDKGTSLLLVNSDKGKGIIREMENRLNLKEIRIQDFMQPALQYSVKKPSDDDSFWESYVSDGFDHVLKQYVGYGIRRKARFLCKLIYYRLNQIQSVRLLFTVLLKRSRTVNSN